MKATKFYWSWNDHAAQDDPTMTRQRAARLLMAWRRTSRRKTSHSTIMRSLTRIAPHTYRVEQLDYKETGVMFIGVKP